MSDTPNTDDVAAIEGSWDTKALRMTHYARKLERELTAARAEIDRLEVNGIHSCHHECQRPLCVMRRERDEALRRIPASVILNRDESGRISIMECGETFIGVREALQSLIDGHNDGIEASEQRDMLAEALEEIASGVHGFATCVDVIAPNALALAKGGTDD